MRLARRAALVSKPWAAGRSSDHQLGVVEGGTQASTGIRAELKPRGAVRVHVHVDHAGATELEDQINTREIGEVYDPRVAPPEATSPGEQIVERSGSRQVAWVPRAVWAHPPGRGLEKLKPEDLSWTDPGAEYDYRLLLEQAANRVKCVASPGGSDRRYLLVFEDDLLAA